MMSVTIASVFDMPHNVQFTFAQPPFNDPEYRTLGQALRLQLQAIVRNALIAALGLLLHAARQCSVLCACSGASTAQSCSTWGGTSFWLT